MTDAELFDAWCRGDRDAGNRLFDRHFNTIYGFFRNKLGDNVDDSVQQTFLACVTGRDRFRRESSFRTYLFGVAWKVFLREIAKRRHAAASIDPHVTSVHDLRPGLSTAYARHHEQRLLLEALRRLPIDYQSVIELYYFSGLRSREIAEIMEKPEATIRTWLARGQDRLRQEVEKLASSPELRCSTLDRFEHWAESLARAVGPGRGSDP